MSNLEDTVAQLHILDGVKKDSIEALLQYEEKLNQFQDLAYNSFDSTTADHYVELAENGEFEALYNLLGGGDL